MNNQISKQQFLAKPKYAKLSAGEKNRRWQAYLATVNGVRGVYKPPRMSEAVSDPTTVALLGTSECGIHYLQALTDPFRMKNVACIPDLHAVPSKKIIVRHKSTFSTGVNGVGYVGMQAQSKANDYVCLRVTTATCSLTASSTLPANGAAPVGEELTLTSVKLPYPSSSFRESNPTSGISGRVVGAAMRIRYIGPELARGGQILALRAPDGHGLLGNTPATLRAIETSKTFPVDREWVYVTYAPTRPGDYQYSDNVATNATSSPTAYSNNMLFYLTGTTTSGGTPGPAPFEVEWVQLIEFIGSIDNVTRTHVDLIAMSHIRNATEQKAVTKRPEKETARALVSVGQSISSNSPPSSQSAITSHPAHSKLALAWRGNDKTDKGIMESIYDTVKSTGQRILGEKLEGYVENGLTKALGYAEDMAAKYATSFI